MTAPTVEEQLRADLWNVAYEATVRWRALQNLSELTEALLLAAAVNPAVVVEIGSAYGGTLFAWSRLPSRPQVIGVSLTGDYEQAIDARSYPTYHAATVITGDSHDPSTLQRVRDQLTGRPIDVLFIDGDHTFGGVRADWEMYGPLVRDGGLVLFHDIGYAGEPDVARYWEQLHPELARQGHGTGEVRDVKRKPLGFGVVHIRRPVDNAKPVTRRRKDTAT